MKWSTTVFLSLCLVSASVSADIYKCKDAKGNDKFQNFPCPIDSIGSKATAAPPKEEAAKPAQSSAVSTSKPNHGRPDVGMKMNAVRAGWGAPKATKVNHGIEIWYYDGPAGTRGVHFDRTGTVLSVNENEAPPEPEQD